MSEPEPSYPVQNGNQRLQKILAELRQDGEWIKKRQMVNDRRLGRLRSMKFFSAMLASAGVSSISGLAISIASLSLSATLALPATVAVVVATVIAGGFGVTCHQGIRYLEKRSLNINQQAQLLRNIEKDIFDKYLKDGKVTASELSELLNDIDQYRNKQEEISLQKRL